MRSRRLIEKPTARRRYRQLSNGKVNSELTEIVAISSSSSGDEADASPVNPPIDSKKKTVPKVETERKRVPKVGTKQKTGAKVEKEDESGARQKKRKSEREQSMVQQKKKPKKGEGEGSLWQRKNEKGEGGVDSVAPKKKKEKGQEGSKGTPKKKREKEVTLPRSNGKGKGEEANKGTPRKKEADREVVAKQKKRKGEGESDMTNLKKRKKKGEGEGEGREGAATLKNNQKKGGEEVAPAHLQINETNNEKKKKKEIKGNGKEKAVNSKKNKKDEAKKKDSEANCECNFPMSRIERIVRSELNDVRISQEALFLINKASEKFLSQFVDGAYACSVKDHKNYLCYKHLASAVSKCKRLDFLSDFVPETITAEKALAERLGKT